METGLIYNISSVLYYRNGITSVARYSNQDIHTCGMAGPHTKLKKINSGRLRLRE